jgi:hypothetical protein
MIYSSIKKLKMMEFVYRYRLEITIAVTRDYLIDKTS